MADLQAPQTGGQGAAGNDPAGNDPADEIETLKVLVTAQEAYPALEHLFLTARRDIRASFRVFDLDTKLRSDAGRAIGETWFDLIVHVLRGGVEIDMVIADFDPIAAAELHRGTWRSIRQFAAAEALAGAHSKLTVTAALHPARAGIAARVLFWPLALAKLRRHARALDALPAPQRAARLRDMPHLKPHLASGIGGAALRARLGPPPPVLSPVTHHQKLACFDGERLYIGGLDLDERRYDTKAHARAAEATWHDVQLVVSGPVVAQARAHLRGFQSWTKGTEAPPAQDQSAARTAARAANGARAAPPQHPAPPEPSAPSQQRAPKGSAFVTTLSRPRRFGPLHLSPHRLRAEIAQAHIEAIHGARRLIYIETQFLRDQSVSRALCAAARARPDLQAVVILPAAPEDVAFENNTGPDARFGEYLQARNLRHMRRAFGPRLFVGAPVRRAPAPASKADARAGKAARTQTAPAPRAQLARAPIIYVHAKVSIFDDQSAIVSSANLNGRSLYWDTEAGLRLTQRDQVETLRRAVFSHWLCEAASPAHFDLETARAAWQATARTNGARPPQTRAGFIVPYDLRAAEGFGAPLPAVPPEMV
ncbi:phospholipase D-like domain-containing protein [Litorivita sp. NS0012-18]|uniref:phospholipase D family protein n=1 Tax=Litorivita sp. NS0012-18 TaxID=3127655 RepID=UPI0031033A50